MTRLEKLIQKSKNQETPSLFEDLIKLCEELEKEVESLKEPKTCESCNHWLDCRMHDLYVDALEVYHIDILTFGVSCKKYEPKDKK